MVMQLTDMLQMTATDWANLKLKLSIHPKEQDCLVYYYEQFADTLKYIVYDISICNAEEQCNDEGEHT